MVDDRRLAEEFRRAFGGEPSLFRAPGRVNLIGEHTDYNDGLVMPAALEQSTWVAAAVRGDRRLRMRSLLMADTIEFDLDQPDPQPRHDWSDYGCGVAVMLERARQRLRGADLLIDSDVPLGAGLSSSAALEVVVGYALLRLSDLPVDLPVLARICQRAENEFVGMHCGIMDQFVACTGAKGYAVMIDCRSLDSRHVPIDARTRLVVCNTMVRHALAGSEYNRRREECERALAILAEALPGIRALRDVTMAQLNQFANRLPEPLFRRCRHVVSEIERVRRAADALDAGDLDLCGRLMTESHASLRDDYEVSCRELDLMAEIAGRMPGAYGARMTGGGFGGSAVALVEAGAVEHFIATVARDYRLATGIVPVLFPCFPGDGVGEIGDERREQRR